MPSERLNPPFFLKPAAVQTVLADVSLREAMSGHGLEQAALFSWQRAADETWALYQRLMQ